MGCCVSTPEDHNTNLLDQQKTHHSCVSKSPPRPEEETVKEVLSETPKPKPIPKPEPEIIEPGVKNEEGPTKAKVVVSPKKAAFLDQKVVSKYQQDPCTPEEISEVSEMCSLVSESISTTTLEEQSQQHWGKDVTSSVTNSNVTTSTTSGELRQRVHRSQGYNSNHHHHYSNNVHVSRRSPIRRADPSPPRRKFPGQGPGSGQVGPRRDVAGENSARRSRSPATRSNVGRSPSARRTGPSPGRVRMVHGPERKVELEENVNVNGNGKEAENEWEGPKESLENPLVSLECFIFL